MNMKRFVAKCLSLPILAIAFAAHAQTVPFDLEIGYRWLDLKGDNGMYRTQINERPGLLIRSFTLGTSDFEGHTSLVDRFGRYLTLLTSRHGREVCPVVDEGFCCLKTPGQR